MSIQANSLSQGSSTGCCSSTAGNPKNNYMDAVRRAADADSDGKVSKTEAQDFFSKADSNGDGKVSGEEMLRALLDGGKGSKGEKSGAGAKCASGADKSSSPSSKDASSGCSSGGKSSGCGNGENKLDADGDGNITIDELERFMNTSKDSGQSKTASKSQDTDADGSLSLREFMKSMRSFA